MLAVALPPSPAVAGVPAASGWAQAGSFKIDRVTPTIATGSTDVVLSGTVTNRSEQTITPVISASLGDRPLNSTSRLQTWLAGSVDYVLTRQVSSTLTALGPSATEVWSVTIPKASLPRVGTVASLPLSLTVSDTGGPVLHTVRSTLEVATGAVQRALGVTWVVPLTLPADPALFGPTGTARTQAWQRAVGTDSTVGRLLDALAGQPVTWLVDPRLVTEPVAQDDNLPALTTSPTPTATSTSSGTPTGASSSVGASSGGTSSAGAGTATSAASGAATGTATQGGTTSASASSTPTATSSPTATSTDTTSTVSTSTASTSTASPTPSSTTDTTNPDTTTDPVAASIGALRERLSALRTTTQQIWWTPPGDPDLAGFLATSGSQGTLRRTVATSLPQELSAISTEVVAAPATALTRASLTTLGTTWSAARGTAPVVLQPGRIIDGSGLVTTSTRRADNTRGLVLYDETLSSALAGTADDGEGVATSRLLAYTMALYLQGPANERTLAALVPRSLTITPSQLADRLTAVRSADWVGDRTGAQTLTATASSPKVTVRDTPTSGTPYPTPGDSPVTHAVLARVEGERRRLAEFGSILLNSADDITARIAALDDTFSTRWRAEKGSGTAMLDLAVKATDGLLSRVAVSPGTVNFFADSGQLSVTVTNTLNREVRDVELTLTPRRAILRVDQPTRSLALGANGRATVRFAVTALAQGEVPIDAATTTPHGLELGTTDGQSSQLQVNVRPTSSWIYWVLGVLGGIVLVIGLIRAVRRGPRSAQELDPSAPTPKDAVVTVTPARPISDTDEDE